MKVLTTGRQAGKTRRSVEWVRAGSKVDRYPGFDRILLTHSIREAERIRREFGLEYHQVFSIAEWVGRYKPAFGHVEVVVDNLDLWVADQLGPVAGVTMTGEAW